MIKARDLRGCYPALITPMVRHEGHTEIDYPFFRRLIASTIDAGCAGFVIAGTTGQSATLTHDEQVTLCAEGATYARGYAAAKGRNVQVIASAGSNATHEAVNLSRRILQAADVDALLHVTGYYNNPPQEGLLRHFQMMGDLAAEFHSSVILYNVPSRTKSNIEAKTTIKLSRHPGIVAIKEAGGDLMQVAEIIRSTNPEEFTVLAGDDDCVAEIIRLGGTGVISATANRWPHEFQVLCELALAGEHEKAAQLQLALQPCVEAAFCAKNPIPLHYMFTSAMRLPLVTIDEFEEPAKAKCVARIEAALAIETFPHVGAATQRLEAA